jgi:hypothetical protein
MPPAITANSCNPNPEAMNQALSFRDSRNKKQIKFKTIKKRKVDMGGFQKEINNAASLYPMHESY